MSEEWDELGEIFSDRPEVSRAQEDYRRLKSMEFIRGKRKAARAFYNKAAVTKGGRRMTGRFASKIRGGFGGGSFIVMDLMSKFQALGAATSRSRLPKKLQGKVKGADRKA